MQHLDKTRRFGICPRVYLHTDFLPRQLLAFQLFQQLKFTPCFLNVHVCWIFAAGHWGLVFVTRCLFVCQVSTEFKTVLRYLKSEVDVSDI